MFAWFKGSRGWEGKEGVRPLDVRTSRRIESASSSLTRAETTLSYFAFGVPRAENCKPVGVDVYCKSWQYIKSVKCS